MHLSIYSSELPFPFTLYNIILKRGHLLAVGDYDDSEIMSTEALSDLWFKANILDTLIINCNYKIIEWTINNDQMINMVEASINAFKHPELLEFFDKLKQIVHVIKHEIVTKSLQTQLFNLLEMYVLKMIFLQTKHINLIEKAFQTQLNAIQQIENDILSKKLKYLESRNELKNWLLNIAKRNELDKYPLNFLEGLLQISDDIICKIAEELEENRDELDKYIQLGESKEKKLFYDNREELIMDLKHWLIIRINGWDVYKKNKLTKIKYSISLDIHKMTTSYQELVDKMEKRKRLFNQLVESFNKAKSIKSTIHCFYLELQQMIELKQNSLTIFTNSCLDERDFCFSEILYEDIGSALSNIYSPIRKRNREFIAIFKQNCLLVEKDITLWHINEENKTIAKEKRNSFPSILYNTENKTLECNCKCLSLTSLADVDDLYKFTETLSFFSELKTITNEKNSKITGDSNLTFENKNPKLSEINRKISLGQFHQFEKIDEDIDLIVSTLKTVNKNAFINTNNNLKLSKDQIDELYEIKDSSENLQGQFLDINSETEMGKNPIKIKEYKIVSDKKEHHGINDAKKCQENRIDVRNKNITNRNEEAESTLRKTEEPNDNDWIFIKNNIKKKLTKDIDDSEINKDLDVSMAYNFNNKDHKADEINSNSVQDNQEMKIFTTIKPIPLAIVSENYDGLLGLNCQQKKKVIDDPTTGQTEQFNNMMLLKDLQNLLSFYINEMYSELKKYTKINLDDISLYTFWAHYEPQIYPSIYINLVNLYSTIFKTTGLQMQKYMRSCLTSERITKDCALIITEFCTNYQHNHTTTNILWKDNILCSSFYDYFSPTYQKLDGVINCHSLLHASLLVTGAFHTLNKQIKQKKKTIIGVDAILPVFELVLLHFPANKNIHLFIIIKILNDFLESKISKETKDVMLK